MEDREVFDIRPTLESTIPQANLEWLRQYLNDDQIGEFFSYSPSMGRHVYTEDLPDGSFYWEARKVAPYNGAPKVISGGKKPFTLKGKWKETGTVCIVEDIISAIKVAEYVGSVCLHGSIIPNGLYVTLGKIPAIKKVLVWLDRDKLSPASIYASKFQIWGKDCHLIMTPKDPKEYFPNEIKAILKDAI